MSEPTVTTPFITSTVTQIVIGQNGVSSRVIPTLVAATSANPGSIASRTSVTAEQLQSNVQMPINGPGLGSLAATYTTSYTTNVPVTSTGADGRLLTSSMPSVVTTTVTAGGSSSMMTSSGNGNNARNGPIVAGSVIGVVALIGLLSFAIWWIRRKSTMKKDYANLESGQDSPSIPFHSTVSPPVSFKGVEAPIDDDLISRSQQRSVQDRLDLLQRTMSHIEDRRTTLLSRRDTQLSSEATARLLKQQADQLEICQKQLKQLRGLLIQSSGPKYDDAPPPVYDGPRKF